MSGNGNGHTLPSLSVCEPSTDLRLFSREFRLTLASVALIFLLALGVWGQDLGRPTEPGTSSVLYKLDLSGQLVPLEPQMVRAKRKFHAWGFSGVTTVYQVEGEKSRVRFNAEGKPEFVVRLEGKLDPLETVQFYHFDEVDGSRVVPIGDFNALGQVSSYSGL